MASKDGHDVVLSTADSDVDTDEENERKEKEAKQQKEKAKEEMDAHVARQDANAQHPDCKLKEDDLIDFTDEGDGWMEIMPQAVKMRIIREATNGDLAEPMKDQYVIVSYELCLLADRSAEPLQSYHSVLHKLGEQEAPPALELAWRHMKPGAVAEVVSVHRFGWGPCCRKGIEGRDKDIPANSHLFIRTTLEEALPLDDPDPEDQAAVFQQRLRIMGLRKEMGNDNFKRRDIDRAIRCYEGGVKVFAHDVLPLMEDLNEESTELVNQVIVDCSSNLAACFLELEDGPKTMEAVECGLRRAPNHLKLHFRAAKAELLMSNYKQCEIWLTDALKISPNDSACLNLQAQLKRAQAKHARESKKLGKNLVGKVNWSDTEPEVGLPKRLAASLGNACRDHLPGVAMGAGVVIVAVLATILAARSDVIR